MGRAGRGSGSGGGGFRGGSHGLGGNRSGGRRLGGHPGNSRSGRGHWGQSQPSRPGYGGYGRRYYRRPFFMPPLFGYGRRWNRPNFQPGGGCFSGFGGCLLPLLLIVILTFFFGLLSNSQSDTHSSTKEISQSTYQREPISPDELHQTDYYYDELGWIKDERELIDGLQSFQKKTKIQPFIYITDQINGESNPSPEAIDQFAQKTYDELFTDEAHLLLVFFENEAYRYHHSYHTVYGTKAKKVMDPEAEDILFDYLDYYYTSDLSEEKYFATVFSETADRIMKSQNLPPWIWIIGIVFLGGIGFYFFKKKRQTQSEPAKNDGEKKESFDEFDF